MKRKTIIKTAKTNNDTICHKTNKQTQLSIEFITYSRPRGVGTDMRLGGPQRG